jgi:hypothetical protein
MPSARWLLLAVLVWAIVMEVACDRGDRTAAKKSGVLATVEGEEITVEAFREALARDLARAPRDYEAPAAKERLLWRLIDEAVVAIRAREAGYEEDPEVRGIVRRAIVGKFLRDRLQKQLDGISISDDDVRKHYAEHIDRYRTREAVLPAIVYIKKPPDAGPAELASLRARADEAREKAKNLPASTRNLGEVAAEYSDDTKSRGNGGEIGWFFDGGVSSEIEEEIADAFFSLASPGDVSEVIETERAFYIVKLVDRQAAVDRPLSMVSDAIRGSLRRGREEEVRRQFLDELREGLHVELAEPLAEILARIEVLPPAAAPEAKTAAGAAWDSEEERVRAERVLRQLRTGE